jgi:hypothetical protein
MRRFISRKRVGALTRIEVLVVLGVVAVLVLLSASVGKAGSRSQLINCKNNLKVAGLAFEFWANDHDDKFPMQVSTNDGGTMELGFGPNTFRHFQVMSNELSSPKMLFCPAESDPKRDQATQFSWIAAPGQVSFASNTNLTYFVGVDAVRTSPKLLLSGDRNITNSDGSDHSLLELTATQPVQWIERSHRISGEALGVVLLTDGSVQSTNTPGLIRLLQQTGVPTNRLAMP